MLCFYCHSQESRGNLKDQKNKYLAYIFKGFASWKKAPKCFYNHQDSACHQASSAYHLVIPSCSDVGEMIDNQIIKCRQMERKYLIDIINCLKFLSRQGIPLGSIMRISRVSLNSNQKPITQVNWINYVLQDGPSEASVLKRFWIIMNPYCKKNKLFKLVYLLLELMSHLFCFYLHSI